MRFRGDRAHAKYGTVQGQDRDGFKRLYKEAKRDSNQSTRRFRCWRCLRSHLPASCDRRGSGLCSRHRGGTLPDGSRKLIHLLRRLMTFNDLAKELNLSTATISRALSRPEIVAPGTRTRVLDAVRRSGYQMNGVARSLRTQSTHTIGVIVSDICNPFFAAIVKAVEDVARTNGYTVLICNADEDGGNEEVALRLFIERQVSGVIRCSVGANPSLLQVLHQKSIPLIDLDRQSGLPNIDTVILNNELGAYLGTRHLIKLGHKRIAIVSGPQHLSNARDRLEGFRKTLRAAHISIPKDYV